MTKTIQPPKSFQHATSVEQVAQINEVIDIFKANSGFSSRRSALRKYVTPIFETEMSDDDVKKIAAETDRDIRPTRTGIRDNLIFDTLLAIATCQMPVSDIYVSVISDTEARNKAGEKIFGTHKKYDYTELNKMRHWFEDMAENSKVYDPADYGVSTGSAAPIFEHVDVSHITDLEEATALVMQVAAKLGGFDRAFEAFDRVTIGRAYVKKAVNLILVGGGYEVGDTDKLADIVVPSVEDSGLKQSSWDETETLATEIAAAYDRFETGVGVASAELEEVLPSKYSMPDDTSKNLINLALTSVSLPPIESLLREIDTMEAAVADMSKKLATVSMAATVAAEFEESSSGEIPAGKTETRLASDLFPVKPQWKKMLNFDVPFFVWEAEHPHVPKVDANYIWRIDELVTALHALVTNAKAWAYGHTGTGKSTLWEQIAAVLNWPMIRVNYDSEITRMDLIGRDTLVEEGGVTKSKFVDGILPTALSGPYMLVNDEVDFVRSDVAYVLQRALEDNGLLITEDGGRVVRQHPLCRIVATGNTQGQGDEFGMYQGARVQSTAFLDRFTSWLQVDYLSESEEATLIEKACVGIDKDILSKMTQYVREHRKAFINGEVMLPLSPRGSIALAKKCIAYMGIYSSKKKALTKASESTILNRAVTQDRVVLSGIMQRIFV